MKKQFRKDFFIFSLIFFDFVHGGIIEPDLLELEPQQNANVLVNFHGRNSPVILEISAQTFPDRLAKIKALCSSLLSLRDLTQTSLIDFLKTVDDIEVHSFWSSNQLVIKNANLSILEAVNNFTQVSRVQSLPQIILNPIKSSVGSTTVYGNVQWGVAKIKANRVWSKLGVTGNSVIVANIDTGIRGTHEALTSNFRSDHGWFDPYTGTMTPTDGNGHGTHTMGTICGQNGIGVAPGAKWIACRGCDSLHCDATQVLACGQWMLSPTNPDGSDPDPSKVPDVVSISWVSDIANNNWYNATIDAWRTAEILYSAAIGNSGPACESGRPPGDQQTTLSVGSTDKKDRLSIFSSRGPAGIFPANYTKPDISAPGSNVYSAWNTGDNAYYKISSTSVATSHVAGTIALMIAANRQKSKNSIISLAYDDMVNLIEKSADTQNLKMSFPNGSCDGVFSFNVFPNNEFGYGRINAFSAVNATLFID